MYSKDIHNEGDQVLKTKTKVPRFNFALLAHLSRRFIGELKVYTGIRPSVVSPSSTFSNVFVPLVSETIKQFSEQSASAERKVINSNLLNKATTHIFLPIAEHYSYGSLFVKSI